MGSNMSGREIIKFIAKNLPLNPGIYQMENEKGEMESRVYGPGEGWCVPLRTKHRVIALTDYTALEASTSHLNDCIII